jgi:hypothetical protein
MCLEEQWNKFMLSDNRHWCWNYFFNWFDKMIPDSSFVKDFRELPSLQMYLMAALFNIMWWGVFIYFMVAGYKQGVRESFISLDPTSGDCKPVPFAVDGTYLADSSGHWESMHRFNDATALYQADFLGFSSTNEAFTEMFLGDLKESLQAVGNISAYRDLAHNLLAWSAYSFNDQSMGKFSFYPVGEISVMLNKFYFFGGIAQTNVQVSESNICLNVDGATTTFDLVAGTIIFGYPVTNDTSIECANIATTLGFDESRTGSAFSASFSLNSFATAAAVNSNIVYVKKLTEITDTPQHGYSYSTDDGSGFDDDYDPDRHAYYYGGFSFDDDFFNDDGSFYSFDDDFLSSDDDFFSGVDDATYALDDTTASTDDTVGAVDDSRRRLAHETSAQHGKSRVTLAGHRERESRPHQPESRLHSDRKIHAGKPHDAARSSLEKDNVHNQNKKLKAMFDTTSDPNMLSAAALPSTSKWKRFYDPKYLTMDPIFCMTVNGSIIASCFLQLYLNPLDTSQAVYGYPVMKHWVATDCYDDSKWGPSWYGSNPTANGDWLDTYDHTVDILLGLIVFNKQANAKDFAIESYEARQASVDGDLTIPNRIHSSMVSIMSAGDLDATFRPDQVCGRDLTTNQIRDCFLITFNSYGT